MKTCGMRLSLCAINMIDDFLHLLHQPFRNNLGKSLMSEAHRPSFAPLLLPPARVHYSRAAKQKEW